MQIKQLMLCDVTLFCIQWHADS